MNDQTAPASARSAVTTATNIDPRSYLKAGLRVVGQQGKALGKIEAIEHDSTGQVIALTVQHGLLRKASTRVSADQVKQVNQDSVIIKYSPDAFKRLAKSN